jgi:hypothetical protein
MMQIKSIGPVCLGGLGLLALLWWGVATAIASQTTSNQTAILYDGSLGTLPDAQAFIYLTIPFTPQATQTYSNGVTILNTMPVQSEMAGYFARPEAVPTLERSQGFTLTFTIQIDEEEHASNNRAGFSVIVLSDDLLGIELGFWEDRIWAQEGGEPPDLFTQAEGVDFDTTADLTTYYLTVLSDTYALFVDQMPILTGPIRDYTAFEGQIDPYETPNLIFLGDNTSSARTQVRLAYVAITIPGNDPEPPPYQLYLPLAIRP